MHDPTFICLDMKPTCDGRSDKQQHLQLVCTRHSHAMLPHITNKNSKLIINDKINIID